MAGEVPSATDGAGTYALSPSARAVWAKSGKGSQWLTLPQHLLDSYGVGLALFDNWLAPSVRQRWGSCLPGGVDDARRLFGFICAAHDVGKASPSFVCQVDSLAARGRLAGLPCASLEELRTGRRAQPHSAVSDWAVRGWLQAHGLPAGLSGQIGSILGAHHGRPADEHMVRAVPNRPVGLGGAEWGSVRTELLDWVGRLSGTDLRFSEWTDVSLPLAVQIGMTGLLIMADWVASNQSYFGLHALDAELSPPLAEPVSRWRDGWDAVALPGPWAPVR